jgi:DNA modification methylase
MKTNVIYCGENMAIMSGLPDASIDLIYIDPPFFSNQNYEIIWGDGAELRAFEDRWKGGIHVYVEWMSQRLREMHRLLKPTGSIYLHLDWHAVHYLKVEMDRIFGLENLRNEIVWHYTNKLGTGGAVFDRQHDTILFYSKTHHFTVNELREPVKLAKPQPVTQKVGGKIIWLRDQSGQRLYKRSKDKRIGDVWLIPYINPMSKERLGYPTQKPEVLLERIISASSNPGDIVADFFCGCGTTLVVAQKLGRQWVGCDVSPTAVKIMRDRLVRAGASDIDLIGMPYSPAELRDLKPFEFQNYIINSIHGTHAKSKVADFGIDGYTFFYHHPVQVKQQEHVGRPEVQKFASAIRREKKKYGLMIGFSFTKPAYEEAARLRHEEDLEMELKTVEEVLTSDSPTAEADKPLDTG